MSILFFLPTIYLATLKVYTKFEKLWLSLEQRNLWQKIWLERKKNGQIKGMINRRRLILFHTIKQVMPNICYKFKNPRHNSPWEIFDANFPMYYIGVRDEKRKKKVKINLSTLFFFPSIYLATLKVYTNLKTLALIETEKSVTENSIGEKVKCINKGKDKAQEAVSLLHKTTCHTQYLPNFKILGVHVVVLEKSLTKKLEQVPSGGTNTSGRCHFLMYKNNLSDNYIR